RTHGKRYGRDGCRVPIPWEASAPAFGFNQSGDSWLPQPAEWAMFARDVEQADPASTLNLYTRLLQLRRERSLGTGSIVWEDLGETAVAFRRGDLHVAVNIGGEPLELGDD